MPEEIIIPGDDNNEIEDNSPKKRIVRRKLRSTYGIIQSAAQKKGDDEIDNVLAELYSDDEEGPKGEIVIKKTGLGGKLIFLLSLSVVLAGMIWAGLIFFPQAENKSQTAVTVQGPTEVALGATTTYYISYANNSSVALKNVVLNVYFPDGFVYSQSSPAPTNNGHNEWDIGTLAPYEKGQITITGLCYGSLLGEKSWRAFLNYQPLNFNSELQAAGTLVTKITSVPITLSVSGPDEIPVGTDAEYSFTLSSAGNIGKTLYVAPNIPSNFVISSSTPALPKNNQWAYEPPLSSSSKKFVLKGKYTSIPDNPLPMNATVILPIESTNYEVASAELLTSLVKNDVNVSLAINGATADFDSRPDDLLNVNVRVKNSSAKEITNASVKLNFDAPAIGKQSVLNWSEFIDKNDGDIIGVQIDTSTRRGTVTWTSKQIPALAKMKPNDVISIDVQLPVKNTKEFDYSSVKNPVVVAGAETNFQDSAKSAQSIVTKPMNISLGSDLTFKTNYTVATTTAGDRQFTVNWILNNTFHPLSNIKVSAAVFGNVSFGIIGKGAGELGYDDQTGELIWMIPQMADGTDVLNSSFTITLHSNNPTQSLLLSQPHLTATDSVTGKTIDRAGGQISLNNTTSSPQ